MASLPVPLRHEMILASAGSGKTHALTNRFLKLLALGVEPERIIALTFSRKSAAEFFVKILSRLGAAALTDEKAAELALQLDLPDLDRPRCVALLRRLVKKLPQLALSTLDSFFVRVVKAYPFELGLTGDFSVLDDHAAAAERKRVYQRLLRPRGGLQKEQKDFMRAFRQATFGNSENRLLRSLDTFVTDWHKHYTAAPDREKWGDPSVIWPAGIPFTAPPASRTALLARLEAELRECEELFSRHSDRWPDFIEDIRDHFPSAPLGRGAAYLLPRLVELLPDLRRGAANLKMGRDLIPLPSGLCAAVYNLMAHLIRTEFDAVIEKTQGLWKIMCGYDGLYHDFVRRRGMLGFDDVQLLLGGELPAQREAARKLSLHPSEIQEGRLRIDFRLDATYDHWLLDEFQDTSGLQWRVLQNLIDEVLQDTTAERTFFAVGDTKQSIYLFRGAEPDLFQRILRRYNHQPAGEPARIAKIPMARSWRSAQAVLDMVNGVFLDVARLKAMLDDVAPGVVDAWEYEEHRPAKNMPGFSQLLLVERPKRDEGDLTVELLTALCAKLREVDPLGRGLTCAVLTLTNNSARETADFIRETLHCEVVTESDHFIATDNPACLALLDLFQAAAHPGDSLAWGHVRMTPLRTALEKMGLSTPQQLLGPVLGRVMRHGFEETVRYWTGQLLTILPGLDSFTRDRLEELANCAQAFDALESKDVDEFLGFAREWKVRSPANPAAIQVMTIHKAKGLGFDVVMLADLHRRTAPRSGLRVAVKRNPQREIQWLLSLPVKDFAQADDTLRQVHLDAETEEWGQNLCKLYVALTRAQHANYVFIPSEPQSGSDSLTLDRIVHRMLIPEVSAARKRPVRSRRAVAPEPAEQGTNAASIWSTGDPTWYEAWKLAPKVSQATSRLQQAEMGFADTLPAAPPHRRFTELRPSELGQGSRPAADLFSTKRAAARRLGEEIHRCLAAITWLGKRKTHPAISGLVNQTIVSRAAGTIATQFLNTAGQAIFSLPAGPEPELWRERPFEFIHDGTWISGVFDRVHLHRDANGKISRAELFEFKTKDAADTPATHAQLEAYTLALSKILDLPLTKIHASIVPIDG